MFKHSLDAMRSLEIFSNIDHWVIYLPGLRSVFRFLICFGESLTLTSHAVCRFQQSNWLIWPLFHTKMKCFFCLADEKRWLEVSNNTVLEMKASKKKGEQQIEFLLKCIWFPLPPPLSGDILFHIFWHFWTFPTIFLRFVDIVLYLPRDSMFSWRSETAWISRQAWPRQADGFLPSFQTVKLSWSMHITTELWVVSDQWSYLVLMPVRSEEYLQTPGDFTLNTLAIVGTNGKVCWLVCWLAGEK